MRWFGLESSIEFEFTRKRQNPRPYFESDGDLLDDEHDQDRKRRCHPDLTFKNKINDYRNQKEKNNAQLESDRRKEMTEHELDCQPGSLQHRSCVIHYRDYFGIIRHHNDDHDYEKKQEKKNDRKRKRPNLGNGV